MNDRAGSLIPVYRGIQGIPTRFGPTVGVIGNFDGVHRGHRKILSAAMAEARDREAGVAITFDPHPEQFLRPEAAPRLITPMEERLRLLAGTGIDAVVVMPFEAALAEMTAREFVRRCSLGRWACRRCMRAATSGLDGTPRLGQGAR